MNYYFKVLKKATDFKSRARRSEYWYFVLFNFIIAFIIGFVGSFANRFIGGYSGKIGNYYTIATLLPSIAVGVRRMHDVGKSGWYLLIPIYNLILACTEGEKGVNKYGEDPKS